MNRVSSLTSSRGWRCRFTLIELLAAIAIIAILAGLAVGAAGRANRKSLEAKTRSQIDRFELAVEQYRRSLGYIPPQESGTVSRSLLEDLRDHGGMKLEDLSFTPTGEWQDPFGAPYHYDSTSPAHNEQSFDIWSFGNDNEEDTEDDVTNWGQ